MKYVLSFESFGYWLTVLLSELIKKTVFQGKYFLIHHAYFMYTNNVWNYCVVNARKYLVLGYYAPLHVCLQFVYHIKQLFIYVKDYIMLISALPSWRVQNKSFISGVKCHVWPCSILTKNITILYILYFGHFVKIEKFIEWNKSHLNSKPMHP